MSGYDTLLRKLDEFIRKYYLNRMLRGALYAVALVGGFYLVVALMEYFGEFGTGTRTFLFWTFVAVTLGVVVRFLILPLSKLMRLGKSLSHEEASEIVGLHFPEVRDKLLNTLQLKHLSETSGDNSMLLASINQRISTLSPVPFASAVDFGENRKYLKYALPPLAIIAVLLWAAPSVLKDSTDRLVNHTVENIPVAPYQIEVLNDALQTAQNADYTVNIEVSGDAVPQKMYVVRGGQQFKLEQADKSHFSYTFRNVQRDTPFQFYAAGFYSDTYTLETLPTPSILNFEVALDFPAYTGQQDETVANNGDLVVPEGTEAQWLFTTRNTDKFQLRMGDSLAHVLDQDDGRYGLIKRLMGNTNYTVTVGNEFLNSPDSLSYRIQVVPDRYPQIRVQESEDSTAAHHRFFTGEIQDDYGFRKLTFNYRIEDQDGLGGDWITEPLGLSGGYTSEQFYHFIDVKQLGIQPGQALSYYFEVYDNDGVHGSKSTRSRTMVYNAPSVDELKDARDQQSEDIKDELDESLDEAKKLNKDLEDLRRQLLEKEDLTWQDKKRLEELLKKQQELQKKVDQLASKNQQKNQQQNEFNQPNEDVLEKQKQLQELMNEVMSEEMREMYEELQRMMEELDKNEIQEQLQEMDFSQEDLEKELERALEQFKQMEWEQKMEETIDELEKLAEEQEKLAEETEQNEDKEKNDELKEKQDELNEKFDELKEEMEELEKMNEELEDPNSMPDTEEQQEQIEQEMQESSDQLEKDKQQKASQSQKKAAEQMQQMAQQMDQAMQAGEQESMEEDMEALRALLENIITLSFDEEDLMASIKGIDPNDPKYVKQAQWQRKLKDDAKMVEDSLFALSKRIIQLQAAVNREIGLVNEHMAKALDQMGDRKTGEVATHQQYVMTSFNNLALLLDEALQQMQQQSSCNKPGTGNCEKPGGMGSKPSSSQVRKMQQQLSKQLEQMKQKMEGYNKGENNSGKNGEMSKELAQMAAKQSAIRKEVEKLAQQLNEDGSGNGNQLKEIAKEMEEQERDLVNKQLTLESLKRQQDIVSRLLKSEKAEREREQDNQRRSTEARDAPVSTPEEYEEYRKRKEQEVELLRTLPPSLKPYYKGKVNEYFNKLDGQ